MKDQEAEVVYRQALTALRVAAVPHMVCGAYALLHYTGIARDTKDIDVFVLPTEAERTLAVLASAGFRTEMTCAHWLGKAFLGDSFVDVIWGSQNGIATVDEVWQENAESGVLCDVPVAVGPVEEIIWSKAFVMERERYDGADIMHLLLARAARLDWRRLLWRFGDDWPLLLSYLVQFDFFFPTARHLVPETVLDELVGRLRSGRRNHASPALCRGTRTSRYQYQVDVDRWGLLDARLKPWGALTSGQLCD